MSARLQPQGRWQPQAPSLRPMLLGDLDRVLVVEQLAYSFPWTRGNFIDSLAAGYTAELLVDAQDELVGYFVAMAGVDRRELGVSSFTTLSLNKLSFSSSSSSSSSSFSSRSHSESSSPPPHLSSPERARPEKEREREKKKRKREGVRE